MEVFLTGEHHAQVVSVGTMCLFVNKGGRIPVGLKGHASED